MVHTWRAAALELVDKIMAGSSVLAGIRATVVHVKFTVLPLESSGALALVRSDEIFAGGSVLTGRRVAFVDLLLAVAAGVSVGAVAPVTVANIFARSVVTQRFSSHSCKIKHAFSYFSYFSAFLLFSNPRIDIFPNTHFLQASNYVRVFSNILTSA